MTIPELTIVTIVKNSATTLEQTIQSVISQKNELIEYIIIDGGSTDGSIDLVRKYSGRIDHWVSEPDNGISEAFNKGIRLASGKYIGILNADDFYEPGALGIVLDAIRQHPESGIFHGSIRYHDPKAQDLQHIEHPNVEEIQKYMSVFHPAMFVSKQAYGTIGPYSEEYRLAMDSEWVHRAVRAGERFHRLDYVIANMRLHGLSHRQLTGSLREFRRSALMHFENRLEANYYFWRQRALHRALMSPGFKRLWIGLRRA